MVVTDLRSDFNPVPKPAKTLKSKTNRIRQKSSKLARLERNRTSILTSNLDKCFFCSRTKNDLHEVFRGRNRQKSMQWGLVVPICSHCHHKITVDKEFSSVLEQMATNKFIKLYSREKFIQEFM